MGGCEDKTWAREAEESPLLEAVARERLLETLQAGKELACTDLYSVEINDSTVITCSSEWCVEVVNKSIHQSKLHLQSSLNPDNIL
jgi:hypothetical protein